MENPWEPPWPCAGIIRWQCRFINVQGQAGVQSLLFEAINTADPMVESEDKQGMSKILWATVRWAIDGVPTCVPVDSVEMSELTTSNSTSSISAEQITRQYPHVVVMEKKQLWKILVWKTTICLTASHTVIPSKISCESFLRYINIFQ